MYEDDFVLEDIIEFEIEGRKFAYKPVTAGDESDWIEEYMEEENGKYKQNLSKLNECKTRNLVKVPYDKETINKMIQVDKEWKDLSKEQRWNLLKKLKPAMFSKIILKINELDNPNSDVKKN
jgi:hypothetical protein